MPVNPWTLFFLCISLLLLPFHFLLAAAVNQQGEALLSWKRTLNGSLEVLSNWDPVQDTPCSWYGVSCNFKNEVVQLDLRYVDLLGRLPTNFTSLLSLTSLIFTGTNLTGSIPKEIGELVELGYLDLSDNALSGEIPSELCYLPKLEELHLNSNDLVGSIPVAIGNLTKLQKLILYDNQLGGKIPGTIGNLKSLQVIRAGGNKNLEGLLPQEIGNCSSLVMLGLAETSLSGSLPPTLGLLKNLETIAIYTSLLSGEIPPELGYCTGLQNIYLYENSLTGSIPSKLGNLKNLENLLLWQNNLVGTIPPEIGNCEMLSVIDVSMNSLTGSIPKTFGNLTSLQELQLSVNQISGEIPGELGKCQQLTHVELDNNLITGTIPSELGNLANLTLLFLWHNKLQGSIPSSLSNCQNLEAIDLSQNGLMGPIPKGIFQLKNLNKLLLLSNNLSGKIPSEIGNCSSLIRFRANDNNITGSIPSQIGNLNNLNFLDLGNNRISGVIPVEISGCRNLAFLDVHSNFLAGNLPESLSRLNSLQFLDASDNMIEGTLNPTLGELAALSKLVLAKNRISGSIPSQLGSWAPPAGVDDMTKLAYLHEPGVLHNLATRFSLNEIYTYTGNILIAVNPFRRLPHLYDIHMMEQYKGAAFGELSPHLFAVADTCYRAMINENGSQSILVSGESGAGKTETTKMLMRYLAFMGGRSATEGRTVEQQVLESNPVLEAFGNAKTVKNNNSSRFGKFVEIQFDKNGKISGAAIRTYLLERSRVCQVSDPERNYHCFYMLCAAPPEDVKKYKLGDPRQFHYLNQSNCYQVSNVDDAKEYLEIKNAMDIVGISQEEQDAIFRVVAAILHLGNIDFVKGKEVDSSKLKDDKSLFHLRTAAELFMCDAKALEDSLCERVIVTPDGNITKPLDPDAAALSRDALAKTVYSKLFDWLVDKINSSIGQDSNAVSIIGVLDIYGFESFKINSFEQLCINLTNEKLQQHFNQHVFKMEQEEYTKEEINWSYVEFVDNQDVLDLIEKKPGGIIALLDEACMFPKSTHETFAQKMYQTYKGHKRFSKPKLSRTNFTINHYAGDVTYQADYFLDKNKDYVVAEHQALLCASKCPFVANIFPPLPEETSKQSKFSSIGSQFKQQLQSLMETLNTTEPHYIRCVKPNTVLQPGIFENFNVLNQLRCGGVLEAIRISCAGYPTKRTFEEFLDRFGMLAPDVLDGSDEKKASMAICDKMGLKGYQMGKTKVFLRAGQMAELDARRAEVLAKAAKLIQRQIRTHLARKEFITLRKTTIHIQKIWRAKLARKLYEHMRREAASIRIQKHVRAHRARINYTTLQASAIVIQSGLRALAARNEYRYRRRTKASTKIQTQWRRAQALSDYKQQKKATVTLQCLWRAKVARKELRKLRMAARETGALKEAKDKLEKRVEELTWRIDIEKHMRTDLEEAKGQEIAKLQNALQEMKAQLDEAHAAIIHEREAAKIAIEQAPPVIKEVPVVDETKLELLTNKNEELETEVEELKKKIKEFEESYSEIENENQARLKEAEEAQLKATQLQETIERLELSLSNLESENQVLCQKALEEPKNEELFEEIKILKDQIANLQSENESLRSQAAAAALEQKVHPEKIEPDQEVAVVEKMQVKPRVIADNTTAQIKNLDNGNPTEEEWHARKEPRAPIFLLTKQRSLTDRQQESHDALLKCLTEDKRFEKNRPAVACIVYKSLLHWRSLEAEKTHIFDKITHAFRSSIESQEGIHDLAYWLSTTSTLLFYLQCTMKASNTTKAVSRNRNSPATLFGKMAQGLRSSSLGLGISSGYSGMVDKTNDQSKVEAKYPAILFKQHLTAYVEKIYGMIRDSLKKEISPFLNLCIQAPRSIRTRSIRGSSRNIHSNIVAKQQTLHMYWKGIVDKLDTALHILSDNYVPPIIARKIFSQVFSFMNVQLFNSLLLRRECCSFSNGEYLKAGLHELELWCLKATDQFAGSSWAELKHIRQAVGFLVLHQKTQKSLEEITNELCPVLSIPQIYRIGTMFWDDKYGAHGLSAEVISRMRVIMTEDSINIHNSSFLLEVDSSIPFLMEEMFQSMSDIRLSDMDVDPPPILRQRSDFQFLLQQMDSDSQ